MPGRGYFERSDRAAAAAGKDILIVGHGVMNASIVCQIKDIPVKDFWSVKMKNAELVRLL